MKILVAVDGSSYTKKMLAYLAAHDEWLGGAHQYTVLHVAPPVPPRAAAVLDKAILKAHYADESEKVLKSIRSFFDKQRIRAEFVAKVGAPADAVSELAQRGKFDLLVMGSRGHGTLSGLVLGSVTTKVMAQCNVPVLIVR